MNYQPLPVRGRVDQTGTGYEEQTCSMLPTNTQSCCPVETSTMPYIGLMWLTASHSHWWAVWNIPVIKWTVLVYRYAYTTLRSFEPLRQVTNVILSLEVLRTVLVYSYAYTTLRSFEPLRQVTNVILSLEVLIFMTVGVTMTREIHLSEYRGAKMRKESTSFGMGHGIKI